MTKREAEKALIEAAQKCDVAALKAALAAGADVNKAKDSLFEANALTNLCMRKYDLPDLPKKREMIKILLDAGSEVGGALGYAAKCCSTENLKLLIEAGVDVNDRDGCALRAASNVLRDESEALAMVELLLEAGADPNLKAAYKPFYALGSAARYGYVEVVKLLLNSGAVADRDSLSHAFTSYWAPLELPALLLESGAPMDSDMVSDVVRTGSMDKLQLMISHGADIALACKEIDLIRVAIEGRDFSCEASPELIKLLIDFGADVNRKAKYDAHEPMLRYVIAEFGEKMRHKRQCNSEEEVVCFHNRVIKILECLIKAGCDINVAGGFHGNTALIEAAELGDPAMVKLLIESGADVNAENKAGKKAQPKSTCPQPQKKEIQTLLKEARASVRAAARAAAKKTCAAKSTAKKSTITKSTTTKKTTTKKKSE